jgi:putative addiction module component (TIGR02574 family)
MIDESLLAKVSSLSPADRLELIGVVWETLTPDDLPVTDAERSLLDARLVDMEPTFHFVNPKRRQPPSPKFSVAR